MIETIHISGIAHYGKDAQVLDSLSTFNYFYGANASGKTTISRIIDGKDSFPACIIAWKGGTKLEALVYNRHFVAAHFHEQAELPGIFTLGEKNVEALAAIASAKQEVDKINDKLQKLNATLSGDDGVSGKLADAVTHEEVFKGQCWAQKQKHDAKLSGAFQGYRNDAAKFMQKVVEEKESNNAEIETLEFLESKAATVFGESTGPIALVSTIDTASLLTYESDTILKKKVVGKGDVDIAAMIEALGNSDWVREGRAYFESNEALRCPFCQQSTSVSLAKDLETYFDEAFEQDTRAIATLATNYETQAKRIEGELDALLEKPPEHLDAEALRPKKKVFDANVKVNLQRLGTKKKEPSRAVTLEPMQEIVSQISQAIEDANAKIREHNKTVANLTTERETLKSQVWKYLLEKELKQDVSNYEKKRGETEKAITSLRQQIATETTNRNAKETDIRALEKEVTSIQPTIDEINALLTSFGFRNFSLAQADNKRCYKIVRADGSDANETLSEGERSFVTFLYFYHLLKGSASESGMTSDRVVVFDDPVSSLDSDVLFIVSSLIKGLCEEVRAGKGHIKQVFILTHNVYFHKEVTFNAKRGGVAMTEETFWTISKVTDAAKLVRHENNPIKTCYELLWQEVRNQTPGSLTIQNTLRRILENYFKILGGVDPDQICDKFMGKERLICKSLFSWVNDGSHSAHDDLFLTVDDYTVETYCNVFRAIFEKTGHESHYRMMMGDAYPKNGAPEAIVT